MEFEERIKEIKEIINTLNSKEISLKEGMELYKKGVLQIQEAQKMLEEAKNIYEENKPKKEENI